MSEPEALVERHGSTAVLTLNAPKRRNVLSEQMVTAIGAAFDDIEADAAINCVVLTGAGTAFCGGAELSTLEHAAGGDFGPVRTVYDGFLRVLHSPLPSIAAVNGAAVGAGFNLALACDVRLAGKSARFDTRFAALRLHPGGGHTWMLQNAVGAQQAMMACLFGDIWDATAALEKGLVAGVYSGADLVPAAIALGQRLSGQDAAFVRTLVASLRHAAGGATHGEVFEAETAAQEWSLRQPHFLVGLNEIRDRMARPR